MTSQSVNVLHVDDDIDFLEMSMEFLERVDDRITVTPVTKISDGLTTLEESEIDCIISDYEMPDQNGIRFLETVRETHPDLPFILYTSKGSEEIASEAISAGVTDYLQKQSGSGQYELLVNRIINVVEQYRAEQSVEETRRRFQRLVEETTDVILIVGADGTISYATPSAERILGRTPDELVGTDGFEPIHPDDQVFVMEEFSKLIETPAEPQTVEFRYHRPDDTYIWVEARGRNLYNDPVINGIVVYVRDTTERKQRVRELEREREWWNAIFEESRDAIFISDASAKFVDVNEAASKLTGYDQDELRSMRIPDLHEETDLHAYREYHERILSGEAATTEARILRADGSKVPVEFSNRRIEIDDEIYMHTVARDISDRKQREVELERQNDRLEEFIGIVSHDLRNPLNVATGRIELAQDECESDHLDVAGEALNRMSELIEDLLSLARETQAIEDNEAVGIAHIAEACWQNVNTADASIAIEGDAMIWANESRLAQLFENLMRNAVEHGSQSSGSHDGGLEVKVGIIPSGFFVADNGPGIAEDDRDRVFESGYSTIENGTGFGLAIVQEIVRAHGWEIHVDDAPDGGVRFEITGVEFVE